MTQDKPQLPLFSSEQTHRTRDDYLTPKWVFTQLDLSFDLDVAAPPWDTFVPAVRKYTKADDGLLSPWEGRVWMNPPYSKITGWVDKFIEHGNGIALLPWAKSAWTIRLWATADAIGMPPRLFDFVGGSVHYTMLFAAFGEDCVEGLRRLGHIRVLH